MFKIHAFTSQPVMNYVRYDGEMTLGNEYGGWMYASHSGLPGRDAVTVAKAVLGRQDYCWLSYIRNWIWEREVVVTLDDGEQIVRRWRLFASKRGFTLEVEDGGDPWGDIMIQVVPQVWSVFLSEWKAKDQNWDQSAWDMIMDIRSHRD